MKDASRQGCQYEAAIDRGTAVHVLLVNTYEGSRKQCSMLCASHLPSARRSSAVLMHMVDTTDRFPHRASRTHACYAILRVSTELGTDERPFVSTNYCGVSSKKGKRKSKVEQIYSFLIFSAVCGGSGSSAAVFRVAMLYPIDVEGCCHSHPLPGSPCTRYTSPSPHRPIKMKSTYQQTYY
jgi:hypothetical protein